MDRSSIAVMSRRTMLAAGTAVFSTPLLGAEPAAGIKAVVLVARKDGMTHDAFVHHWIDVHAKLASSVPGVRGFVGSELLDLPVAPGVAFAETDGIASIWYPSREQIPALLGAPEGKAWLADGDTFISRPLSRNYATREHSIVPGERLDHSRKRMGLLVRNPALTREQFIAAWLGRNAAMARAVPGLGGMVFSEASRGSGPGPVIDGFVEYWASGGGELAGSAALDACLADTATLVDQAQSRWVASREHVALTPPKAD